MAPPHGMPWSAHVKRQKVDSTRTQSDNLSNRRTSLILSRTETSPNLTTSRILSDSFSRTCSNESAASSSAKSSGSSRGPTPAKNLKRGFHSSVSVSISTRSTKSSVRRALSKPPLQLQAPVTLQDGEMRDKAGPLVRRAGSLPHVKEGSNRQERPLLRKKADSLPDPAPRLIKLDPADAATEIERELAGAATEIEREPNIHDSLFQLFEEGQRSGHIRAISRDILAPADPTYRIAVSSNSTCMAKSNPASTPETPLDRAPGQKGRSFLRLFMRSASLSSQDASTVQETPASTVNSNSSISTANIAPSAYSKLSSVKINFPIASTCGRFRTAVLRTMAIRNSMAPAVTAYDGADSMPDGAQDGAALESSVWGAVHDWIQEGSRQQLTVGTRVQGCM